MAPFDDGLSAGGHRFAVKTGRALPALAAAITSTLVAAPAIASTCKPVPVAAAPALCESAAAPNPGPPRRFRHRRSSVVAALGPANHRGRDLLLRPGDRQIAIAKMAYGIIDKDLVDEEVDVFLLRGCAGAWQPLGTALTTDDSEHADEEGVSDSGGRVYFEIPAGAALGPGRHRIHLSVAGDRTGTDLILHVAATGTAVFISDIDGTLTRDGTAELRALVTGRLPAAHRGAPDTLRGLAARGVIPIYLSGRPEPLLNRTRAFLAANRFPPGLVMTTAKKSGAIGGAAARFKSATLARAVTGRRYAPSHGFGDTATDAIAYAGAGIPDRLFYRYTDVVYGGRRFEDYRALLPEFAPCAGAPIR